MRGIFVIAALLPLLLLTTVSYAQPLHYKKEVKVATDLNSQNCEFAFRNLNDKSSSLRAEFHEDAPVLGMAFAPTKVAAYNHQRIAIFRHDANAENQDEYMYDISVDPEFNIQSLELTEDSRFLLAHGEKESRMYKLTDKATEAFRSPKVINNQIHYDLEKQQITYRDGVKLQTYDLKEKKYVMTLPVASSRSLSRAMAQDQDFSNIIYLQEERESGRYLIERVQKYEDEEPGKMFGILSTNFGELRWHTADQMLSLLGEEISPETRTALLSAGTGNQVLINIRYLLQNPSIAITSLEVSKGGL